MTRGWVIYSIVLRGIFTDFCRIFADFSQIFTDFPRHLRRKARFLPSPSLIQLFARSLPVVRMQPIAQRVQPAHRAAVHTLRLLLLLLLCAVLSSSETAPHQRGVMSSSHQRGVRRSVAHGAPGKKRGCLQNFRRYCGIFTRVFRDFCRFFAIFHRYLGIFADLSGIFSTRNRINHPPQA